MHQGGGQEEKGKLKLKHRYFSTTPSLWKQLSVSKQGGGGGEASNPKDAGPFGTLPIGRSHLRLFPCSSSQAVVRGLGG